MCGGCAVLGAEAVPAADVRWGESGLALLIWSQVGRCWYSAICVYRCRIRHVCMCVTYLPMRLALHSLLQSLYLSLSLSLPLSLCLCFCLSPCPCLCPRPAASLLSLLSVYATSLLPVCCLLSLCYVSAVCCLSAASMLSPLTVYTADASEPRSEQQRQRGGGGDEGRGARVRAGDGGGATGHRLPVGGEPGAALCSARRCIVMHCVIMQFTELHCSALFCSVLC